MQGVKTCPECAVPEYITSDMLWRNSGLIMQARDQRHIATFIERENLDALLRGVEDIIGTPIERIILETRRRASRAYMDRVVPENVRQLVQEKKVELGTMADAFFNIGHVMGYGRMELVDYRYDQDDDDFFIIRIEKPYSILLGSADPAAAIEAIIGTEMGFTYREVSEDVYDIKIVRESHPEQYKGRLMMKSYQPRRGDIELETCPSCGGPRALSHFQWDLEKGLINNKDNGRRMVFSAPAVLDAVFEELETELGEEIPEAVIDAQRRFTVDFYSPGDIVDEAGFRDALALRGDGNLRRFDMQRTGLSVRLDNAPMHLLMVGLFQGFFEIANGAGSRVEWKVSPEGDLELEVSPTSPTT